MKNILNTIHSEFKLVKSWNLTYKKKSIIYYPKNEKELKYILYFLKKNKKTFSIKTGLCSYDGKSISLEKSNIIISLKNFNKLININKKNQIIRVQAGAKIFDILLQLKKNNLTMYSVPGGENITVGGAISANVIGKDSSKSFSAFGDSVKNLKIMTHNGSIKKLKFNSRDHKLFIGSFGFFGIILDVELKIRKIPSQNLFLLSSKIKKFSDIGRFLNKNYDYKYIVIDPFFRENCLGIFFHANFIKNSENFFKKKNFKIYLMDKFLFKFSSFFINRLSWKIFYKLFVAFKKKNHLIDLHNFHYESKYKHLIPHLTRGGLLDYEILIKKDLTKTIIKIKKLFSSNNICPIYIIIKKLYKSKKKYFYSFNKNGYSMAIALDKKKLCISKKDAIENFIKKNSFEINICKTDSLLLNNFINSFIKLTKNNYKNIFMSNFKRAILNKIN